MKRFLFTFVMFAALAATVVGCSKRERWDEKERRAMREELRAYRDMVYLDNLADVEFDEFSGNVVEAIEIDYPVYTTFVEMPGKGVTVEIYVVSTIVNVLNADALNMRNIYPYPWLVSEGVLPAGLDHQAQRAFYDCFARKVRNYYPSTEAFFEAVVADDPSTSKLTQFQMECANDLFDWNIIVDETVFFD